MTRVKHDLGEVLLLSMAAGFGLLLNSWAQAGLNTRTYASFDEALLPFIGGGATFGALLLGGHLLIRWAGVRSALAYCCLGGLASFAAFLAWGGHATLRHAAEQGTVTLAIGLPLLIGLGLGAIYYHVAGRELDGDVSDDYATLTRLSGENPSASHISTPNTAFYSGPLQVRTSIPLLFAAGAAMGAMIAGALILGGMVTSALQTAVSYANIDPLARHYILAGSLVVIACFSLALFVPNLIAHKAANYLRITSPGAYVMVAFGVNIIAGIVAFPFLFTALPSALSMLFYRRWAGLEPLPLPEPVWVKDKHALVAEDHALRRFRAVVPD